MTTIVTIENKYGQVKLKKNPKGRVRRKRRRTGTVGRIVEKLNNKK